MCVDKSRNYHGWVTCGSLPSFKHMIQFRAIKFLNIILHIIVRRNTECKRFAEIMLIHRRKFVSNTYICNFMIIFIVKMVKMQKSSNYLLMIYTYILFILYIFLFYLIFMLFIFLFSIKINEYIFRISLEIFHCIILFWYCN